MQRSGLRTLFAAIVAVSAATIADPIVEAASNAGILGAGNYTDHSTLDVLPAFVAASVLGIVYVLLRARLLAKPRSLSSTLRLRESLRDGASRVTLATLPATFAVQIGIVFAMETLEQVAVAGHPLGGTIWLGGPVAVALAIHALACVCAAFALAKTLDALTRAALDIARFAFATFVGQGNERVVARQRPREGVAFPRRHPLASRSGKRAPPLLIA